MALVRCGWADGSEMMRTYHDDEWGVPQHDERGLFELLCLEGAQAGLSWRTVLAKRENYRRAFYDFDIARVAAMDDAAIEALLGDAGLIRHQGKLRAVRDNARAAEAMRAAGEEFAPFLWSFVGSSPRRNRWPSAAEVPARTAESDAMSKALAKRGFRFVGSTICYAFMQATGMVDDHLVSCFRHATRGPAG
jgi:DNA-3-methyladenine glycosylase I